MLFKGLIDIDDTSFDLSEIEILQNEIKTLKEDNAINNDTIVLNKAIASLSNLCNVKNVIEKHGITESLEQFLNDELLVVEKISTEGIKEITMAIWNKVQDLFKRFIAWVKKMWSKYVVNNYKRAKKIFKKASKLPKDPTENVASAEGWGSAFSEVREVKEIKETQWYFWGKLVSEGTMFTDEPKILKEVYPIAPVLSLQQHEALSQITAFQGANIQQILLSVIEPELRAQAHWGNYHTLIQKTMENNKKKTLYQLGYSYQKTRNLYILANLTIIPKKAINTIIKGLNKRLSDAKKNNASPEEMTNLTKRLKITQQQAKVYASIETLMLNSAEAIIKLAGGHKSTFADKIPNFTKPIFEESEPVS